MPSTPPSAAEIEAVPCPRCRRAFAVRAPREGLLERLLSIGYVYPFRCQLCRHRYRALRWGVRYQRHNRRQFERLPTQMPVKLIWGDQEGSGLVSELSIAGATVETEQPIPVGQSVQLSFRSSGEDVEVTVDVSMIRSRRAGEVGVEFTEVSREHEERLAQLVRDLLERMKRA